MSSLFFATMRRLTPALGKGDLAAVEKGVIAQMRAIPKSPFHIALKLQISNDPADAASHFDRFFAAEAPRLEIGAAYTEMNGFDINPDRWYCDLFAYAADGGHQDYDWLSDWQSKPFDEYEINGLEELQDVYASDAFREPENEDASYMSSLLVVVKFQRFMERVAKKMMRLRFPLYVTAHDFSFIASVGPKKVANGGA